MAFFVRRPKRRRYEIILHVPNPAMQGEVEVKREVELIGKTSSLMFKVDDCKKTCDAKIEGCNNCKGAGKAPFGIQALIVDLYGNPLWLIEHPGERIINKSGYFFLSKASDSKQEEVILNVFLKRWSC